jgi:hypothetical protein
MKYFYLVHEGNIDPCRRRMWVKETNKNLKFYLNSGVYKLKKTKVK